MDVKEFCKIIDSDFYTGVPDSLLKPLCNYLINSFGIDCKHHIIGANEGNCVGIAAGYYLSTGKIPVVYLQNSGEGNIINPVVSLLNEKVYSIPAIFIVGWRGEPGVKDEPQHVFQGEITERLLEDIGVEHFVVSKETTIEKLASVKKSFDSNLLSGKSVAFVIKKDALVYNEKIIYSNKFSMLRENIIRHITEVSGEDPIISTTGKASRELYEIRNYNNQSHKYDFLTVGSMGHSSSIALGVAINISNKKIWCIDGDGAVIMHMGALAVIGVNKPSNLVHIVINNESHETVGGMPTVAHGIDFVKLAKACGYPRAVSVDNFDDLDNELSIAAKCESLVLIEVKCSIGARENLGRPTTTAAENKRMFMEYLRSLW